MIDITDLPEVVICLEPGFDSRVLEKYGYSGSYSYYYRGLINNKFIGWNGRKEETRSSREILEEALIVSDTQFIRWAAYYNLNHNVEAKVGMRTLTYPLGRCLSISPSPIHRNISNTMFNTLYLDFKESVLEKYKNYRDFKIMIYFMDNTNSLKIYPNEDDIVGSPLKVSLAGLSNFDSTYKTKISRSQHVEGDPLFQCTGYTLNNSYNDCIQNELLESFHHILGCQPPLLENDPSRLCDVRFNFSVGEEKRVGDMFWQIFQHDATFKCKTPCTTNKYTTSLLHTVPQPGSTIVNVVFDRTVEVTRSTFNINGQTLLTRLGGSVSSGRTLLWILVTLLGASQVISDNFTILRNDRPQTQSIDHSSF